MSSRTDMGWTKLRVVRAAPGSVVPDVYRIPGFGVGSAPSGIEVTYGAFTVNMGNCLTSCTIWFNGMSDE